MTCLGLDNFVNQSVIHSFVGGHEEISVGILCNFFNGLIAVIGHKLVKTRLGKQDFLGLNFNIGSLSLCASQGLMNHNTCIGKRTAFAGCSGTQQEGTHTGSHTKAYRADIAGDVLHCVVNSHTGRHGSTGRINVKCNVLFGIFIGQIQKLGHQHIGNFIINLLSQQQNTIFQQTGNHIHLGTIAHINDRHTNRCGGRTLIGILTTGIDLWFGFIHGP
mmetsp:Transcript_4297/g.6301  ORF Transcript_4297/g.6301 Transcript_4297/m.6301 type:complete len:218 (-) Transcript_4297:152-805(-)